MKRKPGFWSGLLGLILFSSATQATDIFFVNTFSGSQYGDKIGLSRVGLYRDGTLHVYDYEDMIPSTLTGINLPGTGPVTTLLYASPLDSNRGNAMNDVFLNTGLFNTGEGTGDFSSGQYYTRQTFASPVVNGPGTDLLIASIELDFSTFATHQTAFYASFDGLSSHYVPTNSSDEFRLSAVDIIPYYARAGSVSDPSHLSEATIHTGSLGNGSAIPRPVLRELDLSDFGIAIGDSISDLWIQSDSALGRDLFLTMAIGLPDVPEPSSLILLSSALLVTRRR